MSVGYLIVAHHKPGQLLRLVETIRRSSAAPVVVHVDRRARALDGAVEALRRMRDVVPVSAERVSWGHFSIVRAALAGLRVTLDRFPQVQHVKHLSGQDYPLRPLSEFESYVSGMPMRSIMQCQPLPCPGWENEFAHVEYRYLTRSRRRSLRWPAKRRLPPGLHVHFGSAFWCIARHHAEFVLGVPRAKYRLFEGALAADELFFQTLIMNSPFAAEVLDATLTFGKWSDAAPSPDVLTAQDFPDLLASGCFFGRKFDDAIDDTVLDRLDLASS